MLQLRQRGPDYVVVDEGSANGTFVGATRLNRQTPHSLSDGELLRFGRVWVSGASSPAPWLRKLERRASWRGISWNTHCNRRASPGA